MSFKIPNDFPRIDSHVHIHSYPTDGKQYGYEDYKALLEGYRRAGDFSFVNVLAIPYLRTRDVCQNIMIALLKLENPNFYGYGGFVYNEKPVSLPFKEGFSPEEQLNDLMAVGFDGVKMLESKPNARKLIGLRLNDPVYEPLFAELESSREHLVWHVNDPANFWDRSTFINSGINPDWCYDGSGFLSYEEIYEEVFEVLDRHPTLNITFPHLFFMSEQPDRLTELLNKFPNLSVDLTPGVEMYPNMSRNISRWKTFFTRFSNRIIFGTDYMTSDEPTEKINVLNHIYRFLSTEDEFVFYTGETVKGLGLNRNAVEDILSRNFLNKVGKAPRTIDIKALKSYVRKYEPFMTDPISKEFIISAFKRLGENI